MRFYAKSPCIWSRLWAKGRRVDYVWFWWRCRCSEMSGSSPGSYYLTTFWPWEKEVRAPRWRQAEAHRGPLLPDVPTLEVLGSRQQPCEVGNRPFHPGLDQRTHESWWIQDGFTQMRNKCVWVKSLPFWDQYIITACPDPSWLIQNTNIKLWDMQIQK